MTSSSPVSKEAAVERLRAGNERFVRGEVAHAGRLTPEFVAPLAAGQKPFAAILTCSDSRVCPEHIFDCALGELFVCRTAGNLADALIYGSLEYAVAHLNVKLIVALGHSSCGACGAAVNGLRNPGGFESVNLSDVTARLAASALAAKEDGEGSLRKWIDRTAELNVKCVCRDIISASPIILAAVEKGEIAVVGMFYDLASGAARFL